MVMRSSAEAVSYEKTTFVNEDIENLFCLPDMSAPEKIIGGSFLLSMRGEFLPLTG
jgi:hypothetical protein